MINLVIFGIRIGLRISNSTHNKDCLKPSESHLKISRKELPIARARAEKELLGEQDVSGPKKGEIATCCWSRSNVE